MPDGLYEKDALAWAEQQSELLSRLEAGEPLIADVDWEHVIEEVRDVGMAQLRRCETSLAHAMTHLLKIHVSPGNQAVAQWRGEIAFSLISAQSSFTPSMRERIDVADLYADAIHVMLAGGDISKNAMTQICPFTQDDLLDDDFNIPALVAKLQV